MGLAYQEDQLPQSPTLPLDLNSAIFAILSAIQAHFVFVYIGMFYLHFEARNSFNHRRFRQLSHHLRLQNLDPFKYEKLALLAEGLFLVDYRKMSCYQIWTKEMHFHTSYFAS